MDIEKLTLNSFRGGFRASSWIMRHSDIVRLANNFKTIRNPKVLDAGCGNGLASVLLAREGIDVLGLNLNIPTDLGEYSSGNLDFVEGNCEFHKHYEGRNIIFNSWMPTGKDWSGVFKYTKPKQKIIAYVKSPITGLQPGMMNNQNDLDTYSLPNGFVEVDRWKTFGHNDFAIKRPHAIISKTGEVIVYMREDVFEEKDAQKKLSEIRDSGNDLGVEPYYWEKGMPKE